MLTSRHTIRGGSDFRRLLAAAGLAAAFLGAQMLPAMAQGNRPLQQAAPAEVEAEEFNQIELTQSQIDSFMAAQKEIAPVIAKLKPDAEPSAKVIAQLNGIAKKNGFKDFEEFQDIGGNISFVFTGLDPQSKQFTEHDVLIKREIDAVRADKNIPAAQKREILQELQEAMKSVPKLKYPANVALVAKNYERLKPAMEQ